MSTEQSNQQKLLGLFAWKRNAASQNNTKYAETALQLEIYLLTDGGILAQEDLAGTEK